MNVAQLIAAKRDGRELDDREIDQLIHGYCECAIPDYQMAAFAMAVYFRGMSRRETVRLTQAMLKSGQPITWSPARPKVDKHSTGGIGDKTSIPLAPILAECGADIPMISGRGLGATGGTLDKLESIPGFRTDLSSREIKQCVKEVGCVITGASSEIAPADRRLYALRDVTATVPSIPLITASILSKKLSEGLDALILDVKWGTGAFMKTLAEAQQLAESLVAVSSDMGVRTKALITDMNRPLGKMIGNGLEIDESIAILKGQGPPDSTELTIRLCAEALCLVMLATGLDEAISLIEKAIHSGRALDRFWRMVKAQNGRPSVDYDRAQAFELVAPADGYLSHIDCESLGLAVIELGGGRKVIGDKIDFGVGLEMLCQVGDQVHAKQPVVRIFSRTPAPECHKIVQNALHWSDQPRAKTPLIAAIWERTEQNSTIRSSDT